MRRVRLMTDTKSKAPLLAALLISATALAGCGAFQNRHHIEVGSVPDDYRTNHPIVLSEREETLDVPVGNSDTKISVAQRSGIQGFLQNYATNGSGLVQILLPSGSANAAAAQRVHGQIVSALSGGGVASRNIVTASYDASGVAGTAPVRISYRAMTASTEQCGKWPEDLSDTSENKHFKNFGCASQNNLAAMVSNPADLIGPQLPTPSDSAKRSLAISRYQRSTGFWTANTGYDW